MAGQWRREVWRRRPGLAERLAGRALRSPGLARALVTTASLLPGWIIASAIVLAAGMFATLGTGTPFVPLFAPAVAAAGIAYAYGPGIDPAWELSQSMAVSYRMVLLVRVLVVFALNAALGLVASAASGTAAAVTFGWLIPMTAVSALALAAATVTRSANVGVISRAWPPGRSRCCRCTRRPASSPRQSSAPRSSFPIWRSPPSAAPSPGLPPAFRKDRHER